MQDLMMGDTNLYRFLKVCLFFRGIYAEIDFVSERENNAFLSVNSPESKGFDGFRRKTGAIDNT